MDGTPLTDKELFDSAQFARQYHYDGPLGAFCGPSGTAFYLWAPTAQAVTLRLFGAGVDGEPRQQLPLTRGAQGVWQYTTDQNLDGRYYDYLVTVAGETRRTADPYARAAGVNGRRSMVLDLARTDPPGWAGDAAPPRQAENIIYELHVKDFSCDASSGVRPEYRGKFKALCETRTTLYGDGQHPTCLGYVKALGVTHVQLMPVFDYGSVEEGGSPTQFNWGYDPVNYNVPEGSYTTDPIHGEVRIRELKEAVQALHQNGLRVIMDVVYNHTYHLDSWLWRTVPWYYYRQNPDGSASNGSGCGNELATERSMCARYILDSVLYWAEEYHIDGFRFDLMGLMDLPLIGRIRQALDERFGKGEKLLLGEPWSAAASATAPDTVLAHKGNLKLLDENIAVFCDNTRDMVKGSLWSADARGIVNGGGLNVAALGCCIVGWCGADGFAAAPSQVVNYLSCHDDWTLWDKLVSAAGGQDFADCPPALLRQNRLAAAIWAGCMGHLFLLSGEEFARTKQGVKNSYNAPVAINRMDWRRAWDNQALVRYYQGLMALRRQLPALCGKTAAAADRLLQQWAPAADCAAFLLDNAGEGPYSQLLLAYNAGGQPVTLALPDGDWAALADGEDSFLWQDPPAAAGAATLAPVSALLLGRR